MLTREYTWPRLKQDVRQYIRNYYDYRRNKTPRDKTPGLLHPLPVPNDVWDYVVVDGKDMPKDRYGYDYVWTFIDKFNRIMATLLKFKVEQIEQARLNGRHKELQYQAKWKGCDPDETWYSAANFKNAPIVVERFHTEHPEAPGPPVRLQEWIRAAATDEIDEDHPDDNKAEKAGTGPTKKKRHL
ncbi:hypothetical protein DL764_009599 [Monosporascus ibericus]|uniref:Chromo domain-containing protein n=1 Tax=Monosporascus ibericus TaxID=155417 RepID=A0A4Q4SUJ3_9PEZI|nr:hypothetical protein DL764_009599 [Monosporascus ibericus]